MTTVEQDAQELEQYSPRIARRYREGMTCCSSYIPEWADLVRDLDDKLSHTDPDYKIDQIKEKFGGLRFYTSGVNSDIGRALIDQAEEDSYELIR